MNNLRNTLYLSLNDIFIKNKKSHLVAIKYQKTIKNDKDKALFNEIFNGVIKNKILLDYLIKVYAKKTKNKLKHIINIASYQAIFLDKIPDYAIIDQALLTTKKYFSKFEVSFVNKVIRNIIENQEIIINKLKKEKNYQILLSVPDFIYNLIKKQYPNDYLQIFKNFNKKSINGAFVTNKSKISRFFKFIDDDYVVLEKGNIYETEEYKKGIINIQDYHSNQVVKMFKNINKSDLVLDACAGPGTKSIQIGLKTNNLYINDINKNKKDLIIENLSRNKIKVIKKTFIDARILSLEYSDIKFDKILIDAPCSGIGIIKRKPEIKYNLNKEKINNILYIQKSIINECLKILKPDGQIVYSTCTINKLENETLLNSIKNIKIIKQKKYYDLENYDGFYMALIKKEV